MRQLKISQLITTRDSESLDLYLSEIGKIQLITPDEEVELTQKIKEGDKLALTRLINANLRFVVSVAKQLQHKGLGLADLINEGNLGLIKAAQRFDETKGFKFISYAIWWIREAMMSANASSASMIKVPRNKIGSINKIYRIAGKLEQQYEREPTSEEIAEALHISPIDVIEIITKSKRHISMDAPLLIDDDFSLYDTLSDKEAINIEDVLYDESLKNEFNKVLPVLSKNERYIIDMFFGLNDGNILSLKEISERLGLTVERVRQLKESALKKLKKCAKCKVLKQFLNK